jgi:hypothetical protein
VVEPHRIGKVAQHVGVHREVLGVVGFANPAAVDVALNNVVKNFGDDAAGTSGQHGVVPCGSMVARFAARGAFATRGQRRPSLVMVGFCGFSSAMFVVSQR